MDSTATQKSFFLTPRDQEIWLRRDECTAQRRRMQRGMVRVTGAVTRVVRDTRRYRWIRKPA